MLLKLNHMQRLNLHALMGAQRADVAGIRAIWAIQDKLALTAEEETAIELKREFVGGRERVLWNPALALPRKDFVLADTELARVKTALESWEGYGVDAERPWLESLLEMVFGRGEEPAN